METFTTTYVAHDAVWLPTTHTIFSRDVNFTVFMVNLSSTKFKTSKVYFVIHLKDNKRFMKINLLDLGHS